MMEQNESLDTEKITTGAVVYYNTWIEGVLYTLGAFGLLMGLVNLAQLGRSSFLTGLNMIAAVVLTGLITFYLARFMAQSDLGDVARQTWLGLAAGFGLFFLAEVARLVMVVALKQVANPLLTWAWLPGYLGLGFGIIRQLLQIKNRLSSRAWLAGLGLAAGALVAAYSTLRAALASSGLQITNEVMLAGVYSLLDILLLLLALRLAYDYSEESIYRLIWLIVSGALATKVFGNPFLIPASGPQGYEIISIGGYTFQTLLHFNWYIILLAALILQYANNTLVQKSRSQEKISDVDLDEQAPNASAFILTDSDEKVILMSLNYPLLMLLPDNFNTRGAPLQSILGINDEPYREFIELLDEQKIVRNYIVQSRYQPREKKVWITAMLSHDEEKQVNGINIVVRLFTESLGGAQLTTEERTLIEGLIQASGMEGEEKQILLVEYFNKNFKLLSAIVSEYGGRMTVANMTTSVNDLADNRKWGVRVLNQEIMVGRKIKPDELGEIISALLETARSFAGRLAGVGRVRRETEKLNQMADRSTKRLIDQYRM